MNLVAPLDLIKLGGAGFEPDLPSWQPGALLLESTTTSEQFNISCNGTVPVTGQTHLLTSVGLEGQHLVQKVIQQVRILKSKGFRNVFKTDKEN